MSDFWNAKYSAREYIYGTHPNAWFKGIIERMPPGRLLVPGAGEGRDAVYAASRGWEVMAFDTSVEGKRKALALAEQHQTTIHYEILDAAEYHANEEEFDMIALVYMHLGQPLRSQFHRRLSKMLRHGGHLLMEAFSHKQLPLASGGPRDPLLLYNKADLSLDFQDLNILENRELQTWLNEGTHHHGLAEVIRLHAVKP